MSWLRARVGEGGARGVPGPSFAYVFGWVLVMLIGVELVTGAALAAFYSPSTQSAWASVAYVQDQMPLGWLVRGLHFHGAAALVIISGVHLLQTAVFGAYKKPRELVWWLGILLLVLLLGWAITGYVLRWDQAGYWANRVEVGIAAATPVVGGLVRALAIGGNEYGNLTLTRFYALHVVVMPALVLALVAVHVVLARRHGTTSRRDGSTYVARWPEQAMRDVIAMAIVFAALLAYVISQNGADLAAPADPAAAYDARPLWYFRWLFELRELAGSMEKLAAMAAPAVVMGFLVMLPLVDRGPDRSPRRRVPFIAAVVGLLAVIGGLTLMSVAADHGDAELAKRAAESDQLATRARSLAVKYGVPATGAQDIYTAGPMGKARALYASRCKGCHDATSKDRKGPIIAPGHGNRDWLRGFLKAPNGDAYWGHTKLAPTDDAMKPVILASAADLDDLVEALYGESGASDADPAKIERGRATFGKACDDCHAIDLDTAGQSAPGLGGLGTRDYYRHFISNPKSPLHLAKHSEMPAFEKELSIEDRDALAQYLVWLRTASQADLDRLNSL